MTLIIAIGSAIVTLLGILTLLNEWCDHAGRPAPWVGKNRERRAVIVLMASVSVGVVAGGVSWWLSRRDSRIRHLLFDLEVLLAQLDGLVAVAIATGDVETSLGSIQTLVDHIGKYGFKASTVLESLQNHLAEDDYVPLKRGGMMVTVALEKLKTPELATSGEPKSAALLDMQTGIRVSRTHVRRLIDDRTK